MNGMRDRLSQLETLESLIEEQSFMTLVSVSGVSMTSGNGKTSLPAKSFPRIMSIPATATEVAQRF